MSKLKKIETILQYVAVITVPVLCFWLLESFMYNPAEFMTREAWILNIIFYYAVFAVLYAITGNISIGLMIETVLSVVIGIANYFVTEFRSSPIVPWDILSLKTAFSVSDNYSFNITGDMIWKIAGAGVIIIFLALVYRKSPGSIKVRAAKRISAAVAGVALVISLTFAVQQEAVMEWADLDNTLFTPKVMHREDGLAVMFMMDMKYMNVSKPSGYSGEQAEKWLSEYEDKDAENVKEDELPNIIVIMDECFSDPLVLAQFTTEEDYMPFVHKLRNGYENTVSGNLHVSVVGGNTANTEFEFLTGNTMAFLPSGSVPYQQYIKSEIPSMVSWLKSIGYTTNAVHPFYASGWNRDKVYGYMGFDNTYFKDSFGSDAEIIRKYISDRSAFEKVYDIQKSCDGPSFTFLVTMQNHGGFGQSYAGFNPDVIINGTTSRFPKNYLSLMKITDKALEDFIGELSETDEKTVVVFFGDHQPNDIIVNPLLELNKKSCDTLGQNEIYKRYEVPYIMWANFDIDEETNLDISPNYLGALMLNKCKIPASEYQGFLLELREKVPVISTQYTVGTDGEELDKKLLDKYKKLQYYELFDR